jgi:hypothetical protein
MPFREKIAWLSLMAIAVTSGGYFILLLRAGNGGVPPVQVNLGLLVATVIVITLVTMIGAIAIALMNPKDANAGADERDRSVARRAAAGAYHVLLVLVMLAAVTAHLGLGLGGLLNGILAAIVIAELVRCGLEIHGYRRG